MTCNDRIGYDSGDKMWTAGQNHLGHKSMTWYIGTAPDHLFNVLYQYVMAAILLP